jgi:hypothetical protein
MCGPSDQAIGVQTMLKTRPKSTWRRPTRTMRVAAMCHILTRRRDEIETPVRRLAS